MALFGSFSGLRKNTQQTLPFAKEHTRNARRPPRLTAELPPGGAVLSRLFHIISTKGDLSLMCPEEDRLYYFVITIQQLVAFRTEEELPLSRQWFNLIDHYTFYRSILLATIHG